MDLAINKGVMVRFCVEKKERKEEIKYICDACDDIFYSIVESLLR